MCTIVSTAYNCKYETEISKNIQWFIEDHIEIPLVTSCYLCGFSEYFEQKNIQDDGFDYTIM